MGEKVWARFIDYFQKVWIVRFCYLYQQIKWREHNIWKSSQLNPSSQIYYILWLDYLMPSCRLRLFNKPPKHRSQINHKLGVE